MNKIHARRLLKLADFLETLPRKKFDFGTFTGGVCAAEGGQSLGKCGTTACALGWTTAIPQFRRLGLVLDDEGTPSMKEDLRQYKTRQGSSLLGNPVLASKKLFGLSETQYEKVFLPGTGRMYGDRFSGLPGNATPKAVAKNIRKRVAEWMKQA